VSQQAVDRADQETRRGTTIDERWNAVVDKVA